mgnify:CR=1 FL=1
MGVRGDAFTKPSVYHPASVVHIFFPITVSRSYMVTFMFMPIQTMHINVLYSGSVVTAFCDEEDMLKAIYFQTSEMQRTFASYPELLLIDATYKLNDLNMPLYVLMSVDGNGESEIVCLWLTQFEDKETITELVQEFKKHNSRWSTTECIMSDKDMTERHVLSEQFPQSKLLICLFHTLRSMKREVSTEKLGISQGERWYVLGDSVENGLCKK